MLLLNALSLNMVSHDEGNIHFKRIDLESARGVVRANEMFSAVGHDTTAAIFAGQLGVPVASRRITVNLKPGEKVLVGQYRGPRLEEGAMKLPEGATIDWFAVWIE